MKTLARLLPLGVLAFLLPVLLSCGSGSSPAPNNQRPRIVSVHLTEHDLTVSGGETHQFAATVFGSSNTNVVWSVSGCTDNTCGSVSSSGLYTAPSAVPTELTVTITAAAEADTSRVDQAAVKLMPIAVSISPVGAWVAPGGTHAFTASVLYDFHHAGVSWTVGPACSGNCGTLSDVAPAAVTYTAPYTAPATAPDSSPMKLIASSVSDPSKKAEIPITFGAAGGMTEGDYAFVFNGWEILTSVPHEVTAAGRFHADDQGNITQGVEDINSLSAVTKALPFTGNYLIGADGRGSFTLVSTQGSATYHLVLDASRTKGKFIRFDALDPDSQISGSGYFELQDKAAFSLAALAGPYAFGVFGTLEADRLAAVGRFDTDASGAFTGGSADMAQQVSGGWELQVSSTNLELAGLLGAPSPTTGRGTVTLNWGASYNFAYYVISDQKILLVQIDTPNSTTPLLRGQFQRQKGPFTAASFSAPAIFSMAGGWISLCGFEVNAAVGQIIPDGSGSATGVYGVNLGTPDQPFTGSYTVAPNGRSELMLKTVSADTHNYVAYFFSPNEAFLMETSGTDVLFGRFKPQTEVPFSEASLSGTYLTYTGPPAGNGTENDSGLTTFDGLGGLTSTVDVDRFGNLYHLDFYGTYTVAPNGRGTFIFSSPATGADVFWVISPTEIVSVGGIAGEGSALLEYERQEVTAETDVR